MLRVWTLNLTKVRLETIKMCKFQRNIFAKLIPNGLNTIKKNAGWPTENAAYYMLENKKGFKEAP
jgi:hypothetical protein